MYYSGKQSAVGVDAAVVFTRFAKTDYVSSHLSNFALIAVCM